MVPSQFLSVVLEEDNGSGSDEETHSYSHQPTWQNQYAIRNNNSISDQEMWNLTKNLPKALLAECTVEISRTPINPNEKTRKPCFDARVSPVFNRPHPPVMPPIRTNVPLPQYLPPPPQLLHRSEWIEERMDVQDLLTGVEAVYSDNESGEEYEEAASVSIFPITVTKVEKPKPEKVKKQDLNRFSYPCEHCPNVYSNRGALWQHSVATHSVEKTCECKICGRKFYRNCSLALHLKSHSEEEYCQCKECGKSFNRLANLERHMKVHAEAEQFPCPSCDKVFRDKANLLRHAVVHAAPKMFQCEICNKSYKSQDHLDVHFQSAHAHTETSLACSTCGDVFKSFAELMQHDATHTAEKPHLCKLCGMTFTDKNILRKHMMSHTGERLTCTTCGIDFTQKSSLLRHVKRMHPQDADDTLDPSLLLDDQNSGLDTREGSSDNGSVQDMDQEETENGTNSTVEIRKALGSPIKSGGMSLIEQHKILDNQISIVENHKVKIDKNEIKAVSVMNNNVLENKRPQTKSSTNISCKEVQNVKEGTCEENTIKTNIAHIKEEKDVEEKDQVKPSNNITEDSVASTDLKQQTKSEIPDPLSSVDINIMHTPVVKLET
uniref:C2H2-type domain-containing protein n=1 Tax=Graphocephala atropunctata TaxID=36148 RepID=A0A1B6LCP1_9HEMI